MSFPDNERSIDERMTNERLTNREKVTRESPVVTSVREYPLLSSEGE